MNLLMHITTNLEIYEVGNEQVKERRDTRWNKNPKFLKERIREFQFNDRGNYHSCPTSTR